MKLIRASKSTAVRYERDRPGELVHMDVKKTRPDPRRRRMAGSRPRDGINRRPQGTKIGYDYVHSVVDDHSRLAFSEIHIDERGRHLTAEFFARAVAFFASSRHHDRTVDDRQRLELPSTAALLRELLAEHDINHKFIRRHCPWQNGKVERFNRTLATGS